MAMDKVATGAGVTQTHVSSGVTGAAEWRGAGRGGHAAADGAVSGAFSGAAAAGVRTWDGSVVALEGGCALVVALGEVARCMCATEQVEMARKVQALQGCPAFQGWATGRLNDLARVAGEGLGLGGGGMSIVNTCA